MFLLYWMSSYSSFVCWYGSHSAKQQSCLQGILKVCSWIAGTSRNVVNDVYKARSLPQTDLCHYLEIRCLRGCLFLLLSVFECDPIKCNLLLYVCCWCLMFVAVYYHFFSADCKTNFPSAIIKLPWTLNPPVLFCNLFRFDSWDCQHVGHPSHHRHSGRSQTSQGDAGWVWYDGTPGQPRRGNSIILWG